MINIPIDNARKITDLTKLDTVPKDGLFIVHDGTGVKSVSLTPKYCSIIGTTDVDLQIDYYNEHPIPFGNEFTENTGNYILNDEGYILVPEDGIYLATICGCVQYQTANSNTYSYIFLMTTPENTDVKYITLYKHDLGTAFYFNDTAVFKMKANTPVKALCRNADTQESTLLSSQYHSKIFVMKLA